MLPVADFQVKETYVNLPTAGSGAFCGLDPTRWMLRIFPAGSGGASCFMSTLSSVDTNSGFSIPTPGGLELHFRRDAALVTIPWYGFSASGGLFGVIEVLYRPSGG